MEISSNKTCIICNKVHDIKAFTQYGYVCSYQCQANYLMMIVKINEEIECIRVKSLMEHRRL